MCFQSKPPPKLEHIHSNPSCQEAYICHTCWVASISRQWGRENNSMWQTSLFLIACVRSISSLWTGTAVEGVIQHLWQVCSIDRREDERHARVRLCTCAYDRETKRLTAWILTSSFQSWLKLPFMKPVVLLSRQLSQWAQTAKVTSPVPLKTLAGTFFPYLTSRSMNYKVEAPAMIEFALCANIPC